MDTWPVHPYRTATALLISCSFVLSLHNVTSKLHLLLKHVDEVLSVTVEGQQMFCHSSIRFFWVSLQKCHACRVLIHLAENMVFRGNIDSTITHLTSPTTFIWVTVICGMFPVITGNCTIAGAQNACTCVRTPTHMHACKLDEKYKPHRQALVYNYRNVTFCLQLYCVCIFIFTYNNIRSMSGSGSIHFGSL